jgi:pimeloyl-ACP methyl ester carboxylesterase
MQSSTAASNGIKIAYRLEDMADDAVELLEALGLDLAHVVGASVGGVIVQTMAIMHPERVRNLTSIMSTRGSASDHPPQRPRPP